MRSDYVFNNCMCRASQVRGVALLRTYHTSRHKYSHEGTKENNRCISRAYTNVSYGFFLSNWRIQQMCVCVEPILTVLLYSFMRIHITRSILCARDKETPCTCDVQAYICNACNVLSVRAYLNFS